MDQSSLWLALHGVVVYAVGLFNGFPYGRAIVRDAPGRSADAWRVAHSSLAMGGTSMLAFACVLGALATPPWLRWSIVAATTVSGYAFAFAVTLGAATLQRGLRPGGPSANRLVFAAYAIAVIASLVGAAGLLAAITVALTQRIAEA